ncbi:hypothetical protein GQ54DRAFT_298038 [Martensiomyces pterosporus]|nr:hypothetical protein GQ54DRAFT_298038 [Martensiomyces pterosporus]
MSTASNPPTGPLAQAPAMPPVLKMPTDNREVILISVCSALLFVDLVFLVYTFFQRKYLPLKSKNLPLMYWTYGSTVVWFIGDVYSYLTIAPKPSWIVCVITTAWLRMSLGGYLWMSLFQYRVYQFIVIFIWKRKLTGKYFWLPIAYIVLIPLIYGIVAAALPQDMGLKYIAQLQMCKGSNGFFYFSISFVFFQLLAFIFIIFMARNIHTCFNEYREIVICFIVATLALIAGIATFWVPLTPERIFILGALNTVLPIFIAQVYFFVLLGRPVYHSIFDKEEYLRFFLARMRQYNLIREYQMANNESTAGMLTEDSQKKQMTGYSALAANGYYQGNIGGTEYMELETTLRPTANDNFHGRNIV